VERGREVERCGPAVRVAQALDPRRDGLVEGGGLGLLLLDRLAGRGGLTLRGGGSWSWWWSWFLLLGRSVMMGGAGGAITVPPPARSHSLSVRVRVSTNVTI
jgi:hypothetical protein